jgi:hypothetical protein
MDTTDKPCVQPPPRPACLAVRDQAVVLALDVLDRVLSRSEEMQRWLSQPAWGPADRPLDVATAIAAAEAALDALETLGPDKIERRAAALRLHVAMRPEHQQERTS